MRHSIITLAAILGVARAGVIPLSDSEQQEKLDEFARLCESGQVPESGADVNGIQVYCKTSPERVTRLTRHSKEVSFGGGKNQAVFLRPATLEQTHEIVVKGKLEGDKKQVYVVPGAVDNKYRIRVVPGRPKPEKPSIFYLQNGPSKGTVYRREIEDTFQDDTLFDQGVSDYAAEETVATSAGITEDSERYPVEEENVAADIAGDVGADVTNDRVGLDEPVPNVIAETN